MKIGDIARRAGVSASTIRYYEKSGLLPRTRRVSRQRAYDPEILGRLAIIRLARDAGFSIRETRQFLTGFSPETKPAARWRALAEKKLVEIDETIARAKEMRRLIETNFRCSCPKIEDCERGFRSQRSVRRLTSDF